jgi:hypothetical protein
VAAGGDHLEYLTDPAAKSIQGKVFLPQSIINPDKDGFGFRVIQVTALACPALCSPLPIWVSDAHWGYAAAALSIPACFHCWFLLTDSP